MSNHAAYPDDATEVNHVPGYWPPTPMVPGHRRLPNVTPDVIVDPGPVAVDRGDQYPTTPERLLLVVKNVVVTITCIIVSAAVIEGWTFLSNLGDALRNIQPFT
jgi:hypothetical protein